MRKHTLIILAVILATASYAQDKEKVMEKRAKEMHAALQSPNREAWEKYINDNYTQRLIKGRSVKQLADMWQNIHDDFGDSKIVLLAFKNGVQEMIIRRNDDGHKVIFILTPEADNPYKIDRVAIEAGELQGPPSGGDRNGQAVVVEQNGPRGEENPIEVTMKKMQSAISSGNAKNIDAFINAEMDKKYVKDMAKAKVDLQALMKDFKNHEVMSMKVNPASLECIIESTITRKAKKISIKLGTNNKITSLQISDFTLPAN